jgi:hypothetical protein
MEQPLVQAERHSVGHFHVAIRIGGAERLRQQGAGHGFAFLGRLARAAGGADKRTVL